MADEQTLNMNLDDQPPADNQQQVENPVDQQSLTTVEPATGTGITPEEFDAYFERKAAADAAAAKAAADKLQEMKVAYDDNFESFFIELDPTSTLHTRDTTDFIIDDELQLARSPSGHFYTRDGIQVEPYEGERHHGRGIESDQEMETFEEGLLQFEDAPPKETAEPSGSAEVNVPTDSTPKTPVSTQYRLWIESAQESIDLFSHSDYLNNKAGSIALETDWRT